MSTWSGQVGVIRIGYGHRTHRRDRSAGGREVPVGERELR
ncbi:hypothetical protein P3T26_006116 [Streptomyces sp. MAA16]|nr:hypothetical protein [Streptomyces sp. MAA16]